MPTNPPSAAIMAPSQLPIPVQLLEAYRRPITSEGDSRSEHDVNCSAPIETYDSTSGVCNELARIAMNRSAVMQAYDSMFPGAGALRAAARQGSPRRKSGWPGWVRRLLG